MYWLFLVLLCDHLYVYLFKCILFIVFIYFVSMFHTLIAIMSINVLKLSKAGLCNKY